MFVSTTGTCSWAGAVIVSEFKVVISTAPWSRTAQPRRRGRSRANQRDCRLDELSAPYSVQEDADGDEVLDVNVVRVPWRRWFIGGLRVHGRRLTLFVSGLIGVNGPYTLPRDPSHRLLDGHATELPEPQPASISRPLDDAEHELHVALALPASRARHVDQGIEIIEPVPAVALDQQEVTREDFPRVVSGDRVALADL